MSIPFTLRQAEYLVAVADHGNFGRAALACHVAQPSLSAQVQEVEGALGVQLFERDRKGVRLTPAGTIVLHHARGLLRSAHDLVEAARACADPLAGMLRIGVIPTISPYLLGKVTPAIREQLPRLSIRWREDQTARLVSLVESGELDGALLASEADLGALKWEALAIDSFVLAVPARHRLAESTAACSVKEITGETVLLLDDGHCLREQAIDACSRRGLREGEFRATSLPTLAQMVASGMGLTLLPEMAVELEAVRAGLVVRPFVDPPGRTIALAWRPTTPIEPALRAVAAVIRSVVACPAPVRR